MLAGLCWRFGLSELALAIRHLSLASLAADAPFGKVAEALGGSATYFSLAARHFHPVRLVGVVGSDFPSEHVGLLADGGADAPAVVMATAYGEIENAVAAVKRARRLMPSIRAELVPEASHDMTMSKAKPVNQKILDFLKE